MTRYVLWMRALVVAVLFACHEDRPQVVTDASACILDKPWSTLTLVASTPACRHSALVRECINGCEEMPSGMLIDASADAKEKREALQYRLEHNSAAVSRAHALSKRTREITDHATSIRASPRGTPACDERAQLDAARIQSMHDEIKEDARLSGVALLDPVLVQAQSCLDCSNDRRGCDHMDLTPSDNAIAEIDALVTSDRSRLGAH
jgi:hypothetical protein